MEHDLGHSVSDKSKMLITRDQLKFNLPQKQLCLLTVLIHLFSDGKSLVHTLQVSYSPCNRKKNHYFISNMSCLM